MGRLSLEAGLQTVENCYFSYLKDFYDFLVSIPAGTPTVSSTATGFSELVENQM